MALVFNPMSCEEPHKPTYEYTPIPKVVECEDEDVCNCECTCSDSSSESNSQSASSSQSVIGSVSESVVYPESEPSTESETISEAVSDSESQVTSESEAPTEPKQPTFDDIKDELVGIIQFVNHGDEISWVEKLVKGVRYYIDIETGYVYDSTGQDLALRNYKYFPDHSIGKLYVNGRTLSLNPLAPPPFDINDNDSNIDY